MSTTEPKIRITWWNLMLNFSLILWASIHYSVINSGYWFLFYKFGVRVLVELMTCRKSILERFFRCPILIEPIATLIYFCTLCSHPQRQVSQQSRNGTASNAVTYVSLVYFSLEGIWRMLKVKVISWSMIIIKKPLSLSSFYTSLPRSV